MAILLQSEPLRACFSCISGTGSETVKIGLPGTRTQSKLWCAKKVKYDENILITGSEDGWVRFVKTFPNSCKAFENHAEDIEEAMPITKLSLSRCRRILASISHDCAVRFYDLSEIDAFLEVNEEMDTKQKIIDTIVKTKGNTEKKEKKAKNIDFFEDL